MNIPACGYIPSIGAGGKRFYLVRKDGHYLCFWYALSRLAGHRNAEAADFKKQIDVRDLPATYIDGLGVDNLSLPLKDLRAAHRTALRRAVADGFDFAAHARGRFFAEMNAACASQGSEVPVDLDDHVPF